MVVFSKSQPASSAVFDFIGMGFLFGMNSLSIVIRRIINGA